MNVGATSKTAMDFQPKPFVFVLMPFDKTFDDIYRLGIKAACENAGAYAERVDEQIFDGSILQRIYNQISKADIVVADMTGRNPNVFYETGYAHSLGKTVILITQNKGDIPFDLKDYPHIVYNARIVDLLPELEKRVRYFIENPADQSTIKRKKAQIFSDGTRLDASNPISLSITHYGRGFNINIDIHNPDDRTIIVLEGKIGVLSPSKFSIAKCESERAQSFNISKDTVLHIFDFPIQIFPGAWERKFFSILTDRDTVVEPNRDLAFALRLFTSSGTEDHEFIVRIVSE